MDYRLDRRSLLRTLLPLIFIIKIQAMLSLKNSYSGTFYFNVDSTGTTFVMVTKNSPASNPIYIYFFDLAISITGNPYNIANLATANTSYYYAKVRCSPYNQLNAANNSFLIYTTK
jgi:hypothetical protein